MVDYVCKCGKKFISLAYLSKHLKRKHKGLNHKLMIETMGYRYEVVNNERIKQRVLQ